MDPAYSKAQLRTSLKHFATGRAVGMLLGFGLIMLLVRALKPAEYGVYVAFLAALEVIQLSSSLGLTIIALRYIPELRSKGQVKELGHLLIKIVSLRLATLALALMLVYVFSRQIADVFGFEDYVSTFQLYLVVIFFEGSARYLELCENSLMMQGVSQISMVLRTGLRFALLAIVVSHSAGSSIDFHHWVLIDLTASSIGCCFALYKVLHLGVTSRRATNAPNASDIVLTTRRMLRYSIPAYFGQIIYLSYGPDTIKLIASKTLGALQIGAFGFAATFATMLQRYLPVYLLISAIRPLFVAARGRQDYQTRLPFMANFLFKLNIFMLAPVAAFILAGAEEVATELTGGHFPDAGLYLFLFTLIVLAKAMRVIVEMVAQSMEIGASTFFATVLGLGGLAIGTYASRTMGPSGLCIGLVFSEIFWCIWVGYSLYRIGVPLQFDWKGNLRVIFASLCSIATAKAALAGLPDGKLGVAAAFVVCGITFLLVALVVRPFSAAERDLVNSLAKRKVFFW
ncbi:lipopolysaccharide biosynthesis protein [Hydrocarboniphaga sp.]|uniref:lipopolysaccharide biosynthesis protein n=1 Tax=Hydrocarboniphaga sp. TaxID=2033016 RepID=UPI003D09CF68